MIKHTFPSDVVALPESVLKLVESSRSVVPTALVSIAGADDCVDNFFAYQARSCNHKHIAYKQTVCTSLWTSYCLSF